MNDEQLLRSLQSIGKACFVKYFPQFNDTSLSNEDLIELLMRQERYVEGGCITRVTQARKIIVNERAVDALRIVASSVRVSDEVSAEASRLAHNLQR
jgi:propanediol dehydratase large subunit